MIIWKAKAQKVSQFQEITWHIIVMLEKWKKEKCWKKAF